MTYKTTFVRPEKQAACFLQEVTETLKQKPSQFRTNRKGAKTVYAITQRTSSTQENP